jgi:hypothetical protein
MLLASGALDLTRYEEISNPSNMTLTRFLAASSILALTAAASTARENADAVRSVRRLVQDRSGKDVRW